MKKLVYVFAGKIYRVWWGWWQFSVLNREIEVFDWDTQKDMNNKKSRIRRRKKEVWKILAEMFPMTFVLTL